MEATLFYQLLKETKHLPSISLSAEVKIPTAKDSLIGTRKTDFTPFFIATKTTGKFFSSLNLSYTILGKPKGADVNNLFNYAIGTVDELSGRSILFGEIYGNTSAFGGAEVIEIPANPQRNIEISGGETVGSVGYGYYINQNLLLSFGISYDNNHALLLDQVLYGHRKTERSYLHDNIDTVLGLIKGVRTPYIPLDLFLILNEKL